MTILDEAWQCVVAKTRVMADSAAFPLWTDGEAWVTAPLDRGDRGIMPHDGSWMAGDLPSITWFVAHDDDPSARERALRWSRRLENRTDITSFASVSHMFFRGALVPLRAHGAAELLPMLEAAAATISQRFLRIGYMKSFGEQEDMRFPFTTIDDVINLCIPFWYAARTGDDRLAQAVRDAAAVIADRLIRADGSTSQVLRFASDGTVAGTGTYQGRAEDGCWSRGLAWGIYGYAMLHALTGDAAHRERADAMADFWIDHVQDDPSPVWDFSLPEGEPLIRDSFAASLAHAGLLELAAWSSPERADSLRRYTADMAGALAAGYVVGHGGLGILRGAALDVPHGHGVGENSAVIVGDSYFTETVWRLRDAVGTQPLLGSTPFGTDGSKEAAGRR
ncbi:hypothetical protein [Microbacterium soli]|uniref:Glycosyl hydrolase n=1 Tax=Microbacterium soli TaxID=446075 RepID=A0ABP7MT23_9MICO